MVGPLSKIRTEALKRKSFILTTTEYYTKWAEVEIFAKIKVSTVVKFIKTNIIARFGIAKTIVTNNRPQFVSQEFEGMCDRYGIQLHHSSPYYQ